MEQAVLGPFRGAEGHRYGYYEPAAYGALCAVSDGCARGSGRAGDEDVCGLCGVLDKGKKMVNSIIIYNMTL